MNSTESREGKMDYKNMSTEEIIEEYNRWSPDPADPVPTQNMYHERQMRMLNALTPEQRQAMVDHVRQNYEQTLGGTKTIAYVGLGLFFLFFVWAFLAA